jgi:hypothetical protein
VLSMCTASGKTCRDPQNAAHGAAWHVLPGLVNSEERRHQCDACPSSLYVSEVLPTQFPAGRKTEASCPQEQDPIHWQMSNPQRRSSQVSKEGRCARP